MIIGVIVLFEETLGCHGKSRMFAMMIVDLSFIVILFIKYLFTPNVSVSPAITDEPIGKITTAITGPNVNIRR